MNAQIEQLVVDALKAEPAFQQIAVVHANRDEKLPKDGVFLTVECTDLAHEIAGIFVAEVTVTLIANALPEGQNIEDYSGLTTDLVSTVLKNDWLEGDDKIEVCGWHLRTVTQGREDFDWTSNVQLAIGVRVL